jgi:hypothetical protein
VLGRTRGIERPSRSLCQQTMMIESPVTHRLGLLNLITIEPMDEQSDWIVAFEHRCHFPVQSRRILRGVFEWCFFTFTSSGEVEVDDGDF